MNRHPEEEPREPGPAVEATESHQSLEVERIRDYRVVEKLGEGGMGAVYKAVHERLRKTVAIKVLPPRLSSDAQAIARFDQEMKAIGELAHPNIVGATDAGDEGGRHYLVMSSASAVASRLFRTKCAYRAS